MTSRRDFNLLVFFVGFVTTILFFTSSFAYAQLLELDVVPKEQRVNPGEETSFILTAKNNLGYQESFSLYVSGGMTSWKSMGASYLDLPSPFSKSISVDYYPNDKPGTYEMEAFLESIRNPEYKVSTRFTLVVIGEEEGRMKVNDYEMEKSENYVNFRVNLHAKETSDFTVDYSILSGSGKVLATDTRTYTVLGNQGVSHSTRLPEGLGAGTYIAKIAVKETVDEFFHSFEIKPVHLVVKKTEEADTALYQEVAIIVSNEGNIPERNYEVFTNIPTGFVTYSDDPVSCSGEDCKWVIDKIDPYESFIIVYQVNYFPLFIGGLLIAVFVVSFVVFGWKKVTVPSIKKTLEEKEKGEFTAMIEIKNTGKKINNVVIRDQVSPLFEVTGFEALKPAITQTEDGTDLVWQLATIEPHDHRILHYKLKPVINGRLKIPQVYMRYANKKGKKNKVGSKEAVITA